MFKRWTENNNYASIRKIINTYTPIIFQNSKSFYEHNDKHKNIYVKELEQKTENWNDVYVNSVFHILESDKAYVLMENDGITTLYYVDVHDNTSEFDGASPKRFYAVPSTQQSITQRYL